MGAPESNAGDAFHFWWAATRALALIEPDACLRAISLEGLRKDDDPDDAYETVDLAEYYGGSDAVSATRLVLSQLKHSTRHPTTPWTAAVLCRKRRRTGRTGQGRSVAADLAEAYARILSDFGADVAAKTTIALVTNRPADPALVTAVAEAATWVGKQDEPPTKAVLLQALDEPHRAIITTIGTAVGTRLRSRDFGAFLASLDLSSAGSLGNSALARSVQAATSLLSPDRAADSARRLFHLVQQEAMPGGRGGLTAVDVLAELGVPDVADLYPAPARFADVPNPIASRAAPVIAETLIAGAAAPSPAPAGPAGSGAGRGEGPIRAGAGRGGWVVVHGPAGAGKTTTVLQVRDHLPPGSKLILFDCYGAGDYLDTGFERHTPQRFVMQVVNELAQQCGTPLLVTPPQSEPDLWRRLRRILDDAVATLDAGAVLVLAVDAADNAAFAARERQHVSFLGGLTNFSLPDRVAVVLTARTHRVDQLGMPGAVPIPVAPFDPAASAEHLRRHRTATDEVADQFHLCTAGNPRAQFYALTQPGHDQMDTATFLDSCEKTPEPIFADLLESAVSASGADTGGLRWLAAMLALARPVPVPTLAAALQVDPAAVSAFAAGLEPGVKLTGDLIAFRDEDFETYIRDRVNPADVVAAHHDLATMFLAQRHTDADAAASVAEHLDAAGRTTDLLDLVLAEDRPAGIADGFRREQVQARRLVLAARAAATSDDAGAAVRIASRGCDTASRLDTLSRLVDERFDLVARYADVELFRSHALGQVRHDWLAPTLFRVAAALSRDPARADEARADLLAADGWLRRWIADRDGEGLYWTMGAGDVGAAVEAVYRLEGPEAAAAELMRWRPPRFVAEAAEAFADRVGAWGGSGARVVSVNTMRVALLDAGVPPSVQVPIATRLQPGHAQPACGPSTDNPTLTPDDATDGPTTIATGGSVGGAAAAGERVGQLAGESRATTAAENDAWAAWVKDLASSIVADESATSAAPPLTPGWDHNDAEDADEDPADNWPEADEQPRSWRVELLEALTRVGERTSAAALGERWATELPSARWDFGAARSRGVTLLHFHAFAAALEGREFDLDTLLPARLRPPEPDVAGDDPTDGGQGRGAGTGVSGGERHRNDPRRRDREEWFDTVRPLAAAVELSVNAALGMMTADDVESAVRARLGSNADRASYRWFSPDHGYRAWATVMVDAVANSGAPSALIHDLAAGSVGAVRDGAPSVMLAVAARSALRDFGADVVIEVCLRAVEALDDGSHSAGERLEVLGEAAELAARLDDEVGRHLFDRAVDAATGINDDAARLLTVHADLAERADVSTEQASGAARDLVAAAEEVAHHVSDAGVVPYAAAAAAASRLHPSIGLRAVTRWDDQDRQSMSSTLSGALTAAVEHGAVPAWQALCLDHLIEDDNRRLSYQLDLCTHLLHAGAAGRAEARRAVARAGRWLRRRVPTRHQPALAQRLLDWAWAHDLGSSVGPDLATVAGFAGSVGITGHPGAGAAALARNWALHSDTPDETGTETPRRVDAQSWRTLGDDVAALDGGYASGDRVQTFIADTLAAAAPGDRAAALDAVTSVPNRHTDAALSALAQAVTSWRVVPSVRDWAARKLPQLLSGWLDVLAWRSDTARLVSDLRALGDDDAIRRAVLLALPAIHTELTSYGWRNITALLGYLCPPAAAADALLGLLADRAAAGLSLPSPAHRPTLASARPSLRVDVTARPAVDELTGADLVAALLWSAFGHPRRAVRWRAAHAVRDLLGHPDLGAVAPVVHALVECLDRDGIDTGVTSGEGWRDPSLYFYRLSAVVGLLVALDRVAADRPNVLAPHLDVFVRHATSRELPHAQIRELARRTALSLTASTPGSGRPGADIDAAREALWGVNRPDRCRRIRGRSHGLNDRRVSESRRYRFDAMDTLPYWYAPLARVFDVPLDTVAEHAEPWILDEWGLDEADWWSDARELRDQRSYERMGHRHGSIPAEENLRLYLEFHAMMTAAGALVDASTPIVAESWDETDPWQSWLSAYLTRPDAWVSDYSTPVPADPTFFGAPADTSPPTGIGEGISENTSGSIGDAQPAGGPTTAGVGEAVRDPSPTDFDSVLGLDPGNPTQASDIVVVYKRVRLSRPDYSLSVRATSALVSPPHAGDLQRALAAASNPMDWKLPDEGEDSFEVDAGDYQLHGWIADPEDHQETLDEHDPYAAELSATVPLPGVAFREATNSTLGRDGLSLVTNDATVLVAADQWADRETDSRGGGGRSTASSGKIVRVDRDTLLRHLREADKVLILEVQVDRHRTDGDAGYQPPATRIYLLDADGAILGS